MIALLTFCSIFWVLFVITAVIYFNTSYRALVALLDEKRGDRAQLSTRLKLISKGLIVFFVLWVIFSGIYFFVQSSVLFSGMH